MTGMYGRLQCNAFMLDLGSLLLIDRKRQKLTEHKKYKVRQKPDLNLILFSCFCPPYLCFLHDIPFVQIQTHRNNSHVAHGIFFSQNKV